MPLSPASTRFLDATHCAQKYDAIADRVLFLRLSEADYRFASFLDDRIVAPGVDGFWAAKAEIDPAPLGAGLPLHFIFHTGHVGSTLLSRLICEHMSVLPLREPLPLRTLAELHDVAGTPHSLFDRAALDERLQLFLRLWARGFAHTRTVILKATSTAGRLAPVLLAARPDAKAVYLNLAAEPYIATLLAGANAAIDLRGHAQERNRRLERLFGEAPLALDRATAGELAAMAWVAETLCQRAVGGPRVLMIDFEDMLGALDATLARVAAHFKVPVPSPSTLVSLMSRYSKGLGHPYSPALRAQLLAQARRDHADELRKGLQWIEDAGKRFAAVAALPPT
jgi:hypothetical protein